MMALVDGGAGGDTLDGGTGSDVVNGDTGADVLLWGEDAGATGAYDEYHGGSGEDNPTIPASIPIRAATR